jgi:1,4-alpha-glucan branching enzyme
MALRDVAPPLQFPPRPLTSLPEPIRIPLSTPGDVKLRFASLEDRDQFGKAWRMALLVPDPKIPGFYQIDVGMLALADGTYEYECVINGDTAHPMPDPAAKELVKFGGYRGVFHIESGKRVTEPFTWDDELPAGVTLPNNNQMVIYEMPVRWMAVASDNREVDLGTFDKVIFEHLDDLRSLGINAIELLPCQDSPDTLNWGYGTRFFLSPDYDMGTPVDVKYFVKRCHQYGIRVLLDVVMNHSRECPLERLAHDWYYLRDDEEPERNGWGGQRFRYRNPANGDYLARNFQYDMAKFWIRDYHIDGFRIDEFRGINNWDFLQEFHDQAWAEHNRLFPSRPFLVIAEDSSRNPQITQNDIYNDRTLVDSMWNFDFRDEVRRVMNNSLATNWGEPSRSNRIRNMITEWQAWDDLSHSYRPAGFTDLSQAVNYITSHDVAGYTEQRLMNFYLSEILRYEGKTPNPGETETEMIRRLVDSIASQPADIQAAHAQCLERIGGTFALMLTSRGIPMFLAGEEFADVHDKEPSDPGLKQEDPVDWSRRYYLGHQTLYNRVQDLIHLRTQHPALQRNEVEFFYFHPSMDDNDGVRVFAYCRTGGQPIGTTGQVFVVANAGGDNFPQFYLPWNQSWPNGRQLREFGAPAGALNPQITGTSLCLSLAPFQVRVFAT